MLDEWNKSHSLGKGEWDLSHSIEKGENASLASPPRSVVRAAVSSPAFFPQKMFVSRSAKVNSRKIRQFILHIVIIKDKLTDFSYARLNPVSPERARAKASSLREEANPCKLQGYLAHKKQHPPLGPPYGPRHSSTVAS